MKVLIADDHELIRRGLGTALAEMLAGGIYIPPQMLGKREVTTGSRSMSEATAAALTAGLTERQRGVLRCLGGGRSNKEIAQDLGLSLNTVKIHVAAVLRAGLRFR